MKFRKLLIFMAKFFISLGLMIWVVISQINFTDLRNLLGGLNPGFVLLAFLLNFVGLCLGALRWKRLLASQKVRMRFVRLLDSYLVGFFFNLFLPTRIGGDVVRASDLRQATESFSRSASIVLTERFLGFSILFFLAFCSSLLRVMDLKDSWSIWIGLSLGLFGLIFFFFSIYSAFIQLLIDRLPFEGLKNRMSVEWQKFRTVFLSLVEDRQALLWGVFYSFLLQVNVIMHFWLIGKALNFSIPLSDYFFLIPIQHAVLMLPSINGIGLREASSILLLSYYGINPTEATTFGFLGLLLSMALAIVGWIRFLSRKGNLADRYDVEADFSESAMKVEKSASMPPP